ncbi:MAG: hypothetical protein RSF68_12550 [Myroides sp.]
MKLINIPVLLLLFSISNNTFGQALSSSPDVLGKVSAPVIPTNSGIESFRITNFSSDNISTIGSEYVNDKFSEATVNNGTQYFDLRYNNHNGYFEYKKSPTHVINLSKEKNTEITFKDGRKYLLKQYKINKTSKEDYLLAVGIKDSNVKLYKLESVEFIPYKESSNSYEEKKSPEFKLKKPLYFVESDGKIIPIEKSKDLEKAFSDYSKEIKKFVSQKNIDFNSDDMILVQNFVNSIL